MTNPIIFNPEKPSIALIAGFPRSGTTWFANLINSHPNILYRHEILGRRLEELDSDLLNNLQEIGKLSPEQKKKLGDFMLRADITTDRPPFFNKAFLKISSQKIHQLSWLANNAIPFLAPIYSFLYKPNFKNLSHVLIKETRTTVNLEPLIKGMAPAHTFFLVRHPAAAIASHLTGYKSKDMTAPSENERLSWLRINANSEVAQRLNLNEKQIKSCSLEAFLAYRWCAQNDAYLKLKEELGHSSIVIYENIVSSPELCMKDVFGKLNLEKSAEFEAFLNETQHTESKTMLSKDSSSEFYSVFRGKDFDHAKWKKTIPADKQKIILDITEHTRNKIGIE